MNKFVNNLSRIIRNEQSSNYDAILIKAYSYVRFSTKRQAKGDSLMRQLDKSREYAALNNLDLQEASFEDLGVSAFDRSNVTKGALAAFIKAVEEGVIERGSFLLVENLDRLSRSDVLDAMSLLSTLVKLGIRVVTLVDGRVLDEESIKEPMNLLYAVLIFVRANEESTTKADRIKKAHKRKRDNKSAFAFGQGPGWLRPNATKTGWEVIPDKAESVIKVFEYASRGIGSTAIARIANREKWPVPGKATDWHKTLPHKLVHNRRVLGDFEPQVKDGAVRRATGECWENYYPPIVSIEVFNTVQAAAIRRQNLPKRRDAGYHNIFQGFLHCGHCGATFSRKSKNSSNNSKGYAIYVCADRERGLTNCPNWNARALENALIPPLINCVSAEIMEGNAKMEAMKALEHERTMLTQAKKSMENMLSIVEDVGHSDAVISRIRGLEETIEKLKASTTKLAALANDPVSVVWDGDVDAAVADALVATRDITDEKMGARAALHQSFSRVISSLLVWPCSHAVLQIQNHDSKIFLPLSKNEIEATAILGKSGIAFKQEEGDLPEYPENH